MAKAVSSYSVDQKILSYLLELGSIEVGFERASKPKQKRMKKRRDQLNILIGKRKQLLLGANSA